MTLDLENWQNRKYQTLNGREAWLAAINAPGEYPIIGKRLTSDGEWRAQTWPLDGVLAGGLDLVNAPEKPAFVPGWFWVDHLTGELPAHIEDPDKEKWVNEGETRVRCRIPPPYVIEAMKLFCERACLATGDAEISEAYGVVTKFFHPTKIEQ